MLNIFNPNRVIGAVSGDPAQLLGKFLYFSLSSILVEKDKLAEICASLDIPYAGGKRLSVADAFRSATGDIRDRISSADGLSGRSFLIYCRDNERQPERLCRELVKETLNQRTNEYLKLANISYDKESGYFSYDDLAYTSDTDPLPYCQQAEHLFELYQRCANRKQIESIAAGYLRSLEATKLSVNGHLYFVPRYRMEKVDVFEEFIALLSANNLNNTQLMVNSFYIVDDAKQREKMTEEFYSAVKKEIAEYQDRADYLIQSGSRSPSVMERWALKIETLEQKKKHYEDVLRRELDGLDDEFNTLKFLSQELTVRARNIRFQKQAA